MTAPGHRRDGADSPFRILSICVANVCRSVVTDRLIRRDLAARLGPLAAHFHTGSAGTRAMPGRTIHPYVRDILCAYGARSDGFASQRLAPWMVTGADLVLTATAAERDHAIELVPAALSRTFTLREFARLGEHVAASTAADATGTPPATVPDAPTATGSGASADVRWRARAAVAEAHRMRGLVPYLDPAGYDIADPGPTGVAFSECAAGIAAAVGSVLAALCPMPGGPERVTVGTRATVNPSA